MPEHISELYLLTVLGMTINKQPLNFSTHVFTVSNTRDAKIGRGIAAGGHSLITRNRRSPGTGLKIVLTSPIKCHQCVFTCSVYVSNCNRGRVHKTLRGYAVR